MATTYDWPASLPFVAANIAPRAISQSGGQTATGVETIVDSGATVWLAQVSIQIRSDAQLRALRGIRSQVRGRVNRLRFDLAAVTKTAIPASLSGVGSFTLSAGAALGASSLSINVGGMTVSDLVGCWVSIGSDWLHEIASASGSTIVVNPPLRAAASLGASVSLSPNFVARLAEDNGLAYTIGLDGFADLEFNLIEAMDR